MNLKLDALKSLGTGPVQLATAHVPLAPVAKSRELERILALPRFTWKDACYYAGTLESKVRRPEASMGLRPLQRDALHYARERRGLFAPIAVGGGKTLLAMLLPTVLDVGPTVILTTSGLVKQGKKERLKFEASFNFRDDIHWMSYGILSSPKRHSELEKLSPKLIVADEAHNLAARDSARTKRFLRYMKAHPETLFCAMSGTMLKRSIRDFAHLLHLALRDWMPLPRDYPTLSEWAEALDVSDNPRPVGALMELEHAESSPVGGQREARKQSVLLVQRRSVFLSGEDEGRHDGDEFNQGTLGGTPSAVERARAAVRRRIVETPGVVASGESELGVGLEIYLLKTPHCPLIAKALKDLRRTWETPDGDMFQEASELARHERSLKLGAFSKWVWEDYVSAADIAEWKDKRRVYQSELRAFLKLSRPLLDSPALVERAMTVGDMKPWDSWQAWLEVFRRVPAPKTEWRWVSRGMVEWAKDWIDEHLTEAIVWTPLPVFGWMLDTKVPYFGEGEKAHRDLTNLSVSRTIACSIKAHGVGKNLQAFNTNLVMGWPPSGDISEQLLGRTHRLGQQADVVRFYVPDCFREDLDKAIENARFIEQTLGARQKLLQATIVEVT